MSDDHGKPVQIEITRDMIIRAAEALRKSGALSEPVFGVSVLAEKVLRMGLLGHPCEDKGSSVDYLPSKTAYELDRYL